MAARPRNAEITAFIEYRRANPCDCVEAASKPTVKIELSLGALLSSALSGALQAVLQACLGGTAAAAKTPVSCGLFLATLCIYW